MIKVLVKTIVVLSLILGVLFCGVCVFVYLDEVRATQNGIALNVGFSGRRIVHSIISANAVRKEIGKKSVWPTKDKYETSNDYFVALLTNNAVADISFATFAGGGVMAAPDAQEFLTTNHNVWNVVAGIDDDSADELPFLFTKNFSVTADELKNADPNDNTTRWGNKLTGDIPRIGNAIIVVSKGAAINIILAKDLSPSNFLNDATYPGDIEILKAVD